MRLRNQKPICKQPTPDDLIEDLLSFINRKFYQGNPIAFAKDRRRLLDWVVLWPAAWLDKRGVTVPASRYRKIFMNVFMDGLRFGNTDNITYLPAWLAKVIQSHFQYHGDEIYEEAKNMRTLVENALVIAHQAAPSAPDPVRELALAKRLLKPGRRPSRVAETDQLGLL